MKQEIANRNLDIDMEISPSKNPDELELLKIMYNIYDLSTYYALLGIKHSWETRNI